MNQIIHGDSTEVAQTLQDAGERFDLIYLDPPFNTGKTQKLGEYQYEDKHDDYINWLQSVCEISKNLLQPNGVFCLHLDSKEVHYAKVMADKIFGRNCFLNEIIWSYDYGARSKKKWSAKHDNILIYVNDIKNYIFNYNQIDRIPYMAPGLVGPEKAARGKTLTDVHWCTIVPTQGKERTGYPTQKPLKLIERFIKVHSQPEGKVLDLFAGSGTVGEAAAKHNRFFVLVDKNPDAINVMKKRLKNYL